jgi:hypothetical protein
MTLASERPLHDAVIIESDMREVRASGAITYELEGARYTSSGASVGQVCAAIVMGVILVAVLLAFAKAVGRLS